MAGTGADLADIEVVVDDINGEDVQSALAAVEQVEGILVDAQKASAKAVAAAMADKIVDTGADLAVIKALVEKYNRRSVPSALKTLSSIDDVIEHGAAVKVEKELAVEDLVS